MIPQLRKTPEAQAPLPREHFARLQLIRSENVGPVTYFELLKRHGNACKSLEYLSTHAQRGGLKRPLKIADAQEITKEYERTQAWGARFLFHGDPHYPPALQAIYDPPPVLVYKGDITLLGKPCIGIVGARNASLNARKFAAFLAKDLSQEGYAVVSGLARGIDTCAHEGSLEGGTVACVAGGINTIYPPENAALFDKIIEQGLLVSEAPWGTQPQASLFPRRNRLISGVSQGIVVVEAALKSGSLITARFALEQGREVFAVPGFPLDPRAQGTNDLIQKGATLLQSARDVTNVLRDSMLKTLPVFEKTPDHVEEDTLSEQEYAALQHEVLSLLSPTPICVDELRRECHISNATLCLILLELELAGRLTRLTGNQVCIRLEG